MQLWVVMVLLILLGLPRDFLTAGYQIDPACVVMVLLILLGLPLLNEWSEASINECSNGTFNFTWTASISHYKPTM